MNEHFVRSVSAVARLKTPLGVIGLSLIILYGILSQVLSMDVFSDVGGENTFTLLSNIVDKVFYVALASLVLGLLALILGKILDRKEPLQASISLIDAGLDPNERGFTQETRKDGTKVISRLGESKE